MSPYRAVSIGVPTPACHGCGTVGVVTRAWSWPLNPTAESARLSALVAGCTLIMQIRASVGRRACASLRIDHRFSTAPDGHLRDQVAAHIEGAARLTEDRVSIM